LKNKPSGFPVGMAPYQVTVAYDGTEFSGFQRQKNARSVQGELENALQNLGWLDKAILFAGRTDAGVHAEAQVISFQIEWKHGVSDLKKALNDNLPGDIAVQEVKTTHGDFHPRYDAKTRIYHYQIYTSETRNPLFERFYWRVWPAPDSEILAESTKDLIGTYDFRLLGCEINNEGKNTMRTVDFAEWQIMEGNRLFFIIGARSFLYHMVRRIVFLLVKIGQRNLEGIRWNLINEDAELPAGLAPAKGLFLEKVIY